MRDSCILQRGRFYLFFRFFLAFLSPRNGDDFLLFFERLCPSAVGKDHASFES